MPDALVIVDERELDAYKAVVPEGQLFTHPGMPTVPTLTAIRNYVFDDLASFGADVLVWADDDVYALLAMPGWSKRRHDEPETVRQVLENAAQCAIDAGCKMFGFNPSPNGLHFKPQQPITLHSWVGSVLGFVGDHGLRYDARLAMHEDTDVCLASLMRDRIIWRDDRWSFTNYRMTNAGGLASYRSEKRELEEQRILHEKWGRYVGFKSRSGEQNRLGKDAATVSTQIRVPRRQALSV